MPFLPTAPRVHQLEGNMCEITWETIPPMRGDPVSYVLQVLVGRESEYRQVGLTHTSPRRHFSALLKRFKSLIQTLPLSSHGRFLRGRRVYSRSLVSKETQTTVSAWGPAGVAKIRARSCADHWAPPLRSRCVARSRPHRESSAPWKQAKGRASSRATSASRRWSCACSRASPSSSPACYNTSSWSEGILTIGLKEKVKSQKKKNKTKKKLFVYERTEWNQKQTLETYF